MPEAEIYSPQKMPFPLVYQGKVRDIFAVGDDQLLIVASDRLSAFDVVLPDPIPGKGITLTRLSNFWFDKMADIMPNHLLSTDVSDLFGDDELAAYLRYRSVLVRKLRGVPAEAIVRGYLIGSGWKDYCAGGTLCGISLPQGLVQAQQLPAPLFTPSTKATVGDHDENISFKKLVSAIGEPLAESMRDKSVQIYNRAADFALKRGIIIADTKFEFGVDGEGELVLMDELLTSDSSRFWPQADYRTGISPPSFDKQFVRDYLETLDWDKSPPGPRLPQEIIERTSALYATALEQLTDT